MSKVLAERCAAIELLVLDVDGVLTDGQVIYAGAEAEIKAFHVRDGSALAIWKRVGKRAALISGRDSPAVTRRAAELGVEPVLQGSADKLAALRHIVSGIGVALEHVAAIGDDLPDLPVLAHVGLAVAVADACPEVREAAHYVTQAPGGRGAVREAIELVLRCQGIWQGVVEGYRSEKF
jgi:3-deoxy-D-manno-octulosonate 8-phosphate phosphatase (KDO 8-P phosphatase)